MEVLQNPVMWRALEWSLMVAGGIVLAIIGYRLFLFGLFGTTKDGRGLSALKRVMLGGGPGLFFLGFGAMVLITAVGKGGGWSHAVKDAPSVPPSASQLHQPEPQAMDVVGEDSATGTQSRGIPPASAAGEVSGKQAAVTDGGNTALVGGNVAVLMKDFTPAALAPRERKVLKAVSEEFIRKHAVTEFEKKFQNRNRKSPPLMAKSALPPPTHPRRRPK
jgi:hypothetical protein